MQRQHLQESKSFIQAKTQGREANICLMLGTGFGFVPDLLLDKICIPYGDIPHFPVSTVKGHAGQLVIGKFAGSERDVILMQGRFHFYEGYPMQDLAFPIRVLSALGIDTLLTSSAVGAVHAGLATGDLLVIEDMINLSFSNPLIGPNDDEIGPRFPDASGIFDPELIKKAQQSASQTGIELKKGVYAFTSGPSFETPAEVRFMHKAGADVVGMSMLPENLSARHCGMKALGFSLVTNMGAGVTDEKPAHEEVLEVARGKEKEIGHFFQNLLLNI